MMSSSHLIKLITREGTKNTKRELNKTKKFHKWEQEKIKRTKDHEAKKEAKRQKVAQQEVRRARGRERRPKIGSNMQFTPLPTIVKLLIVGAIAVKDGTKREEITAQ